jgi:HSP20 family protein
MTNETREEQKEEAAKSTEVEVKSEGGAVEEAGDEKRSLWDFEREFERAFENFFARDWLRSPRWELPRLPRAFADKMPNINVIDRDDQVVVEAELPGVGKDDLDISLSDNTVTIKASTRKEEVADEGDYHRREISAGFLSRTVTLPANVEGDKAKAEFQNGMLTLTLPKAAQAKRVNIQVD